MLDMWQDALQRVVLMNPRHFASWLLPDARYIRTESSQLSSVYHLGTVLAGPLLLVDRSGEELLLHIEFQGQDESMDTYMFARHTMALRIYNRPIQSYIICIHQEPVITPPLQVKGADGESLLCFDYRVIKLWEYTISDLLETGLAGLLPLLPLASDGACRKAVNIMIDRISEAGQFDLLEAGFVLARQACTNELDRYWLSKKLRAFAAPMD